MGVTAVVSTLHKHVLSTRNLVNSMKFLSYSPPPRLAPPRFSTVERLTCTLGGRESYEVRVPLDQRTCRREQHERGRNCAA
jgi:hypothetical protein